MESKQLAKGNALYKTNQAVYNVGYCNKRQYALDVRPRGARLKIRAQICGRMPKRLLLRTLLHSVCRFDAQMTQRIVTLHVLYT